MAQNIHQYYQEYPQSKFSSLRLR